ncbi:MAG TPA: rhomboid family intramembrane serine protease [Dokdonella sp.]|uniref:rhomboid family intramembrane serine protease n=1 Tax=Dokdonella sp. TaxID=2291710 RepID=UPI002B670719|nr:rhomboid family intramembrane serine protease [Dokdonella sp.]HUD42566.1 rhomboid family intramembrane serine protease [Dokdonella sp.]
MLTDVPPVTRALLIANVAMFVLQQWFDPWLIVNFALWPLGPHQVYGIENGVALRVGFELWQVLTYGFLHGSVMHIAFNMLALWMFGGPIERLFGSRPFAVYYLVCVIGAAAAQLIVVSFFTGGFYPTVGASGGVMGLLLAFGMMYPQARVMALLIPVPMPAWLFVILYGVMELIFGITRTQSGVAHFAHLGGMVVGWVLIQYWRGRLPIKPRRILMR